MENILDRSVVSQVQEVFAELKEPVQLLYFRSGQDCEYCDETQQLLEELAGVDPLIGVSVHDLRSDRELSKQFKVDKPSTIVVAARDGAEVLDLGIRFAGVPSGHEFSTLINDILLVSRRDSGLSPATRDFLKGLEQPLLLQVFVTPT